jgi:hypothetical protein
MRSRDAITYWAIASLLAEVAFPRPRLHVLGLLELTNASIHALGHVLVLGVPGLGDVEELQRQLADAVGWTTDDTTTLALDAAAGLVHRPLVEAGDVDVEGAAICLLLVVLKTDVGASKGAVGANQVVEQIPCRRRLVALGLGVLLLFECESLLLFLLLALLLLPLLG